MTSLDDFAETHPSRAGVTSYIDTLPQEIRDQILESRHGHAVVAAWLIDEGYEKANQAKVGHFRKAHGWHQ